MQFSGKTASRALSSIFAVLCAATSVPLSAQQMDPHLFDGLRWRLIGPFRGGRVNAVAGVRGQSNVFYFGAVGGGVWKSTDAGRSWKPIFDSQPIASIGAIGVAPSDPSVIYVGSGEADMRSAISYGNGMYKSNDAGKTWAHIGLNDSRQIGRILVDAHDPNIVYVAALGHPYGPNGERGVFRSRDGGKSWQRVLFHDENTGAIDLAFDPKSPATLYAALWQTRRPPWSTYPPSNGPGSGLYRSTDGGDHWTQLTGHGLPSEGLGRMGIAVAPANPRRIYLIADAKEGGLYRSDDGGENWQRVSAESRIWGRGWYFGEARVDPKDADTVYVSNTSLYRSRDAGKSFTAIKGAPGGDDYHGLWIDPDEPQRMILGSDQGAIVTLNGGETWSSWYNQPTAQLYHVITDSRFPYWVYGAQQDSGSAATPSRSTHRTIGPLDWRPVETGGENGYIAADPQDPYVIYGGTVSRQDLRAEEIQEIPPTLAHPGAYRRTWTLPVMFSPLEPHVLYFGSQVLFRTADGGKTWQKISPDLTREDPGAPSNLDAATAADAPAGKRRGVIYSISPSPVRKGEIWIGTDDGLIQVTRDEGKTWQNVTPPALTPWSKVTHIEASRHDANTVYAAVDRHRLEDYAAYLYRTHDSGKTWERASRGIPDGSFLNCIREDPVRKGLLYACTELGVYVSFNEGDDWQPLQLNLPVVSVRDLVVHGDDLVIATHGRSLWILDDVTPLRQYSAEVSAADAWLFRPQTAYRVRPGSDQGTPFPPEEPQAENPPNGAIVDYFLKAGAAGPVTLEILDGDGKLVRRYSSEDAPARVDPNSLDIPMYWIHPAETLSAKAGMHRFVWDLRYAAPPGMRGRRGSSAGALTLSGEYTAKLIVAGHSLTQELTVKMDPNISTPQSDLVRQFQTASRLTAEIAEVNEAIHQLESLHKAIAARAGEAKAKSDVASKLNQLDAKAIALLGPEGGGFFGLFGLAMPDTERVSVRQLTRAFNGLFSLVESADLAPTPDALTAISKYEQAARTTLAEWKQFVSSELPQINTVLKEAGLAALPVTD